MLQIVLEIRKLVLFSKLNVLDFRKLFLNQFYKLYLIRRNVLNTNNVILNSRYSIWISLIFFTVSPTVILLEYPLEPWRPYPPKKWCRPSRMMVLLWCFFFFTFPDFFALFGLWCFHVWGINDHQPVRHSCWCKIQQLLNTAHLGTYFNFPKLLQNSK